MEELTNSLRLWGYYFAENQLAPEHQRSKTPEACFDICVSVLMQLDPTYFEEFLNQHDRPSVRQIKSLVGKYYELHLNLVAPSACRRENPRESPQDVMHILLELVFRLALKVDQSRVIINILKMDMDDQQRLMPVVHQAVQQGDESSTDQDYEYQDHNEEVADLNSSLNVTTGSQLNKSSSNSFSKGRVSLQMAPQHSITGNIEVEPITSPRLARISSKSQQMFSSEMSIPALQVNSDEDRKPREEGPKTARTREFKELMDELEMREVQNRHLRDKFDDLDNKYREMEYHYNTIKEENQRLNDEIHLVRNEKHELVIQLGMSDPHSSYSEILLRYRQEIASYQTRIQELEHIIDNKNAQIQERNIELEHLMQTFGSYKALPSEKQQKLEEFERLEQEYKEKIQELTKAGEYMQAQYQQKEDANKNLTKQLGEASQQIRVLRLTVAKNERTIERYKEWKKLYKEFDATVRPQIER